MENIEKNAAEAAKKGQMVAFFLPTDIGSKLQDLFVDTPGDAVQPEDMHITLGLFHGENNHIKKARLVLQDLAQSIDPVKVKISGFGKFSPHKSNDFKHVLYATPESEELLDLHDTIFSAFKKHGLSIDNGDFEFKPHITIKYCNSEPDVNRKMEDPIFTLKKLSLACDSKRFDSELRGT